MIKIRWALLCNDVEKNHDDTSGNLLGVIEEFVSPTVPLPIEKLAVALGLQYSGGVSSQISVIWRFVDTGEIIFRSDQKDHHLRSQSGKPFAFIYAMFIHNIILPRFGEYYLEILINDRTAYLNSYKLREG